MICGLMEQAFADIAARYRRFAEAEARGASALYEQLALHVTSSEPLLRFIAAFPSLRQQPNLFLAAVRHATHTPQNGGELEALVASHGERIAEIMRTRTTQTNEPNRCAVLLPLLARLPGPLALLEVGASAGLCLLPDRFGYDYGGVRIGSSGAPVFPCAANEATPLPHRMPEIFWRMGLDLNPLSVRSGADVAWLETLVWPGQEARGERLSAAIAVAKSDPPEIRAGDLLKDVPGLLASGPETAHRVVFHSAVLAYLNQAGRDAFRRDVARSGARWISFEAPHVFPDLAARAPSSFKQPEPFLLALDGEPVAWAGPHGQWIEWFAR